MPPLPHGRQARLRRGAKLAIIGCLPDRPRAARRKANPKGPRSVHPTPPQIVDARADGEFKELCRRLGHDPDSLWLGGYVGYEWEHIRHFFSSDLVGPLGGRPVLEFGSNIGATAIVLASLGARVAAVEVDPDIFAIGQANAKRYGMGAIDFRHVPDTTRLPFASGAYGLVSCNSVLEYVPAEILGAVCRELDRVLAPGGLVLINGTSNRLWPREIHSRRWLANYVPRSCDRFLGRSLQRGVFPSELRAAFPGYRDRLADRPDEFLRLKRAMGASPAKAACLGAMGRILAPAGLSLAALMPNIAMVLEKP
jgi:SAM-dependent methyltransferase